MLAPSAYNTDHSIDLEYVTAFPEANGRVFNTDILNFLKHIPDAYADMVFVDPPFNLGKVYSDTLTNDDRSDAEYSDWISAVLEQSVRKVKDGGALYLYHLPIWAMRFGHLLENTMQFRHWIAISMKSTFPRAQRLYPAHYALLYFTKGKPSNFVRPRIAPAKCRKCGENIRDYGGYKSIIQRNGGVNLSDVWDDLSPVRHRSKKYRAQNELPQELYRRVFAVSGAPGLTYLDLFAGSGSGVIQAIRTKMRFEACDISKASCSIIRDRVSGLASDDGEF